jgi:branched-chain amino acid transport system permease protein
LAAGVAALPLVIGWALEDDNYWMQILIWVLFFAYCSAAWNLIGGFAGQYSFGHAAFLGIGAYVSTVLYLDLGVSPWIGMIAGGVAAATVGAIIGYPCFRLRGAFFSLVTIAFAEMLRVGTELTDKFFGFDINGVRGLVIPPRGNDLWAFQFVDKRYYAYVMLAMLAVVLAVGQWVKRSRLGYYLAAIGDDEDAVASLGTNPARVKLVAMLLSAFVTALAGTFYAQFILFITPTRLMSLDFSVQMVIMAVLGGMGTVLGPLLGAAILVPVAEVARALWGGGLQGVHLIVYGAILMAVVLYVPKGIEPWLREVARDWIRRIAVAFYGVGDLKPAGPNAPIIQLPEGALFGAGPAVRGGELRVDGIARSFGGAVGVRGLSFSVSPGEVVGLIGPNGAGKTTAFNLITGFLACQSGRIVFDGHDLAGLTPDRINRLGIARTFQIVRPFTKLSTVENVMVAALPRCLDVPAARAEALRYLSFVGLSHRADTPADGLSTGERKRLELARALSTRPRLLLLDEVAGGLDQRSLPGLVALIHKIKREGVSLLVIEHNLRVISEVADRIVMLHLGEPICDGRPSEVLADPRVIDIYVGGAGALR